MCLILRKTGIAHSNRAKVTKLCAQREWYLLQLILYNYLYTHYQLSETDMISEMIA